MELRYHARAEALAGRATILNITTAITFSISTCTIATMATRFKIVKISRFPDFQDLKISIFPSIYIFKIARS